MTYLFKVISKRKLQIIITKIYYLIKIIKICSNQQTLQYQQQQWHNNNNVESLKQLSIFLDRKWANDKRIRGMAWERNKQTIWEQGPLTKGKPEPDSRRERRGPLKFFFCPGLEEIQLFLLPSPSQSDRQTLPSIGRWYRWTMWAICLLLSRENCAKDVGASSPSNTTTIWMVCCRNVFTCERVYACVCLLQPNHHN